MITDAIISVFGLLGSAIIGLVGLVPVPNAASSMGSLFSDLGVITGNMAALGAWIPWPVAGAVIVSLWLVFLAVMGIRVVRMVLSLVTGGGGAT